MSKIVERVGFNHINVSFLRTCRPEAKFSASEIPELVLT